MKIILILTLCLCIPQAFSKAFIAQVEQLRGTVTQLKPGAHDAISVSLGDKILEDTSLLTGERSFVRIKFLDGSLLNLGPSGKIVVVQMAEEGRGVVSLLKGTIRTQVEKAPTKNENKFFVKTRSAALGVRGTDFETIYNPDNKMTSLVTFKGEVAMANVKETSTPKELKKVRVNNEDIQYDQKKPQKTIDQILKSKEAVVVKPGQFSGTVQKMEVVSQPVKISPIQFNALYKNAEMQIKGEGEDKSSNEVQDIKLETKKAIKESSLVQAEQEAPPEGYFNAKTKKFAPKAGGFVDLKTGLYVPPHSESEFDPEKKIFIPNKVGTVNSQTGEYIPPQGLLLTANEGFVVDKIKFSELEEGKKAEAKENLLAMSESMNKNIAKDLVLAPEKYSETELPVIAYSLRETYTKNILIAGPVGTHNNLTYSKTDAAFNRHLKSSSGAGVNLQWYLNSDGVFQPLVEFGVGNMKYEEPGIRQNSERLFNLAFGGRYYYSNRLNLISSLSLEQNHFVTYTSEGTSQNLTPELKAIMVPKLRLGINAILTQSQRFQTLADLGSLLTAPRHSGDFVLKTGAGFYAGLAAKYSFTERYFGKLSFQIQNEFQKAHDTVINETIRREGSQIALNIGAIF